MFRRWAAERLVEKYLMGRIVDSLVTNCMGRIEIVTTERARILVEIPPRVIWKETDN